MHIVWQVATRWHGVLARPIIFCHKYVMNRTENRIPFFVRLQYDVTYVQFIAKELVKLKRKPNGFNHFGSARFGRYFANNCSFGTPSCCPETKTRISAYASINTVKKIRSLKSVRIPRFRDNLGPDLWGLTVHLLLQLLIFFLKFQIC